MKKGARKGGLAETRGGVARRRVTGVFGGWLSGMVLAFVI